MCTRVTGSSCCAIEKNCIGEITIKKFKKKFSLPVDKSTAIDKTG